MSVAPKGRAWKLSKPNVWVSHHSLPTPSTFWNVPGMLSLKLVWPSPSFGMTSAPALSPSSLSSSSSSVSTGWLRTEWTL